MIFLWSSRALWGPQSSPNSSIRVRGSAQCLPSLSFKGALLGLSWPLFAGCLKLTLPSGTAGKPHVRSGEGHYETFRPMQFLSGVQRGWGWGLGALFQTGMRLFEFFFLFQEDHESIHKECAPPWKMLHLIFYFIYL